MGGFDKLFLETFGYDLADYDLSLDEVIDKYKQANGKTGLYFMSIKALLNSADIVQHFVDAETLELHPAFHKIYPDYNVFKCNNLALVSFSDLLEIHCQYSHNRGRYSLHEELDQTEQVLLNSALGYLKISKLGTDQELYSTKGHKDGTKTIEINHRGIILIPANKCSKDELSKFTITKQDDNEVSVEYCTAYLDHSNHTVQRTGVRHTFRLTDGVVSYHIEPMAAYSWMDEIRCPMDFRKNPYNKTIWEHLSDEPAYQGTSLFVDSNHYHYGLINNSWMVLNFDQLPWGHSSIPADVFGEYQLYTNITKASQMIEVG